MKLVKFKKTFVFYYSMFAYNKFHTLNDTDTFLTTYVYLLA